MLHWFDPRCENLQQRWRNPRSPIGIIDLSESTLTKAKDKVINVVINVLKCHKISWLQTWFRADDWGWANRGGDLTGYRVNSVETRTLRRRNRARPSLKWIDHNVICLVSTINSSLAGKSSQQPGSRYRQTSHWRRLETLPWVMWPRIPASFPRNLVSLFLQRLTCWWCNQVFTISSCRSVTTVTTPNTLTCVENHKDLRSEIRGLVCSVCLPTGPAFTNTRD